MKISYIKYPVTNLGPGNRIAIWTNGCNRGCKNCMSSYANFSNDIKDTSVETLISKIKLILDENIVDGITISGGEPFLQTDLYDFILSLKEIGIKDILVYTGYLLEELTNKSKTLKLIDVLIDGPYIDELNDNKPLRGSSNQRIFVFNKEVEDLYKQYLKQPRSYELITENNSIIVVGMLPKNGIDILELSLKNL